MRSGQILIGMGEPLTALNEAGELARAGVTSFAMELIPRITRAQSMDVLSSLATISGYEAVLLAAKALPKIFPMLMTAADYRESLRALKPRVFVNGEAVPSVADAPSRSLWRVSGRRRDSTTTHRTSWRPVTTSRWAANCGR